MELNLIRTGRIVEQRTFGEKVVCYVVPDNGVRKNLAGTFARKNFKEREHKPPGLQHFDFNSLGDLTQGWHIESLSCRCFKCQRLLELRFSFTEEL